MKRIRWIINLSAQRLVYHRTVDSLLRQNISRKFGIIGLWSWLILPRELDLIFVLMIWKVEWNNISRPYFNSTICVIQYRRLWAYQKIVQQPSMKEIKSIFFWRAILAEFLGMTLYIAVVIGVVLSWNVNKVDEQIRISLCFGLALASISYMFYPASGGQLNPAVTISCLICRRISVLRALLYLIVQCGGGLSCFHQCTLTVCSQLFDTCSAGLRGLRGLALKWPNTD